MVVVGGARKEEREREARRQKKERKRIGKWCEKEKWGVAGPAGSISVRAAVPRRPYRFVRSCGSSGRSNFSALAVSYIIKKIYIRNNLRGQKIINFGDRNWGQKLGTKND